MEGIIWWLPNQCWCQRRATPTGHATIVAIGDGGVSILGRSSVAPRGSLFFLAILAPPLALGLAILVGCCSWLPLFPKKERRWISLSWSMEEV